ncbi:hypothetical protein Patl1_10540 [Pistacia atlantica]|uniref:Uncharacterized protein n=1 Tax=Pistacia atlantica TaxID=434234 RepID=A0ACC1A512_9ROSI|nr:hypothetical protein Patl1_10540 [Pistacia atlantica]
MDEGGENMSWIGNLFQKFEDLYLEVDVAMREEIRNVENNLQTIGANVVNFYRDMVLDNLFQSSEDVVVEEAADDSIDILVSDASNLRNDEVHHEEETKKEVAHDIGYLVSYTSEMGTDEDHYEEDTEEEDDASGEDNDEDYSEEDTEEEADDASEILTDEEDTDASDIETYKYNSEEDTEEEALYVYDNDVLGPGALKTVFNEGRGKVLLEFHKLISSASVEPTDEAQYDSSLQQKVDSGVYAEENLAEKRGSFESMKIDENRDMPDRTEFEITGKIEEKGMLRLSRKKLMKLFGVTVEIPDDEFCDSEWVIV